KEPRSVPLPAPLDAALPALPENAVATTGLPRQTELMSSPEFQRGSADESGESSTGKTAPALARTNYRGCARSHRAPRIPRSALPSCSVGRTHRRNDCEPPDLAT